LIVDDEAERLRGQVLTVTGPSAAVRSFAADRAPLNVTTLGPVTRATVRGAMDADTRVAAERLGVEIQPVSLQQLFVSLTATTVAPERETVG
jgi:ABC-2 type transport system ATP-binding protein